MRMPAKWEVNDLVRSASAIQKEVKPDVWAPYSPLDYSPWWYRFIVAWRVFTGKYDAVEWPNGQ